jgi:hypothetical protein
MKSYLFGMILICLLLYTTAFAVSDGSIIENAQLVSQNKDNVIVDKQVMVVADLTNGQDRPQNFAYIVQIRDQNNLVISLSWLTGSLTPGQTFSPALSWTPTVSGMYTIEIFVWESIKNPDALSAPLLLSIDVVEN